MSRIKKSIKRSKWLISLGVSLCLLVLLIFSYWPFHAFGASETFTETFDTTDYRNTSDTTADWDIGTGTLQAPESYWSGMAGTVGGYDDISTNGIGPYDMAFDSGGNPWVIWVQSGAGIYFARWNGVDDWVGMGGVNPEEVTGHGAATYSQPYLRIYNDGVNDIPCIYWTDNSSGGVSNAFFVYWDSVDSSWDGMLGNNPDNISNFVDKNASLSSENSLQISSIDSPYVVWRDNVDGAGEIYFSYFDGVEWAQMDGDAGYDTLRPGGITDCDGITLKLYNDNPYIVASCGVDVIFRRWDAISGTWSTMAGNPNSYDDLSQVLVIGTSTVHLEVDSNGYPFASWIQTIGDDTEDIYFTKWDGAQWETMAGVAGDGPIFNVAGSASAHQLKLDTDDYPQIVVQENSHIYFRHWNGAAWSAMDGVSNYDTLDSNCTSVSLSGSNFVNLDIDSNDWPAVIFNGKPSGATYGSVCYTQWSGAAWVQSDGATTGDENITLQYNANNYSTYGLFDNADNFYVGFARYGTSWSTSLAKKNVASQYFATSVAKSITIDTVSQDITSATLTLSDETTPASTDILYYLSADGGTHWEAVTPGDEHTFTNTGSDLRWSAALMTTDGAATPSLGALSIEYTFATPPGTPTLISPDAGAAGVSLNPTFEFSATDPGDGIKYILELNKNAFNFYRTTLIFDQRQDPAGWSQSNYYDSGEAASFTLPSNLTLNSNGLYYWRVRAVDKTGRYSDYSEARAFTVGADQPLQANASGYHLSSEAMKTIFDRKDDLYRLPGTLTAFEGNYFQNSLEEFGSGATNDAAAVVDVDFDQDIDVVLATPNGGLLFRNDDSGGFPDFGENLGSDDVNDIAYADFDLDGDSDLFLLNGTGANSHIYFKNNGDDNYTEGGHIDLTCNGEKIKAGDLNNDGYPDIVATCDGGDMVYALNDGDGTFGVAVTLNSDDDVNGISLADMDKDGWLDIVAGCGAGGGSPQNHLYTNDQDGTFTESNAFGLGDTQDILTGDFDNDGDFDVVVSNFTGVYIYYNSGNGTFQGPTTILATELAPTISAADLTGDESLDLVIYNNDDFYVYSNAYGLGSTFTNIADVNSAGLNNAGSSYIADFDKDGDPDILTLGAGDIFNSTRLWFNNSNVVDYEQTDINASVNYEIVIADFNNDGWQDFFKCNNGNKHIYLNNGDETFTSSPVEFTADYSFCYSAAAIDIDNDGDMDVVTGHTDEAPFGEAGDMFYINDGNGVFTESAVFSTCVANRIVVTDIDDDGDQDILLPCKGNDEGGGLQDKMFLNDGDGNLTEYDRFNNVGSHDMAAGDFDNDGDIDVITDSRDGFGGPHLYIWWNNGDAPEPTFTMEQIGSSFYNDIITADIDNDGDLDFITNGQYIWRNDGTGSFTQEDVLGGGSNWVGDTSVGDVNNDGFIDIFVGEFGGGPCLQNHLYINNGRGYFNQMTAGSNKCTANTGMADFNNDGLVDLIEGNHNQEGGADYIYWRRGNYPTNSGTTYSAVSREMDGTADTIYCAQLTEENIFEPDDTTIGYSISTDGSGGPYHPVAPDNSVCMGVDDAGPSLHWATYLITTDSTITPAVKRVSLTYNTWGFEITNPDSHAEWTVGDEEDIAWNNLGVYPDEVALDYSTNGFETSTVITNSWANTISPNGYPWTIPDDPSDSVTVRVCNTARTTCAYSDEFTITGGGGGDDEFTITSPNGGETLYVGETVNFQWDSGGSFDNVALAWVTAGANWGDPEWMDNTLIEGTPDDGSYSWQIPAEAISGDFEWAVANHPPPFTDFDMSDDPITVTNHSLVINTPTEGQNFNDGDTIPITWTGDGPDNIGIVIRINGGNYTIIASTANDGVFNFIVGEDGEGPTSNNVQIRLCVDDVNTCAYYAESETFSLNYSEPTYSYTITSPNGGETLHAEEEVELTWTSAGEGLPDEVLLVYCFTNNCSGDDEPYSIDDTLVNGTPNDGSYNWTIPNEAVGETVWWALASYPDGNAPDYSDDSFQVASGLFTVTYPTAGVSLTIGSSANITWTNIGEISTVELYFSPTAFAEDDSVLIAGNEANDGSYTWTVINDATTTAGVAVVCPADECGEALWQATVGISGTFTVRSGGRRFAACSDGNDNDGDGKIDYPADPGCSSTTDDSEVDPPVNPPPSITYQCNDGLDNDSDGKIDYPADPGCSSTTDNDETDPTIPYQCNDGIDNDSDGKTDYPADPGCSAASDNDETDPVSPIVYQCSDGIDNDSDGRIDYPEDPGCTAWNDDSEGSSILPQCNDGLDNDSDGKIDFPLDPDCISLTDNDESAAAEGEKLQCNDGLDNDSDGKIDFPADPGCASATDNSEVDSPPAVVCGNGIKEGSEECDGTAGVTAGYTCTASCLLQLITSSPICGNNILETGEACDDGNLVPGDGCSDNCTIETPENKPPEEPPTNTNEPPTNTNEPGGNTNEPPTNTNEPGGNTNEPGEKETGSQGGIPNPLNLIGVALDQTSNLVAKVGESLNQNPIIQSIIQSPPIQILEQEVFNNPAVEKTTERVAAPALVAIVVANLITEASVRGFLPFLSLLFTEPFLYFTRKRYKDWGIVYDALSKKPLDLAIVRLYKRDLNHPEFTGQLMATKVTDIMGRYHFLTEPGTDYYLTVTKPNYLYPSRYTHGKAQDEEYANLYHAEAINTTEEDNIINFNIPVDPDLPEESDQQILKKFYFRKVRTYLAVLGPILAVASLMIMPTIPMLILVVLHLVTFTVFRRLTAAAPKLPGFGVVHDRASGQPLKQAIIRVFDTTYNKLLGTEIANSQGQYYFLVGRGKYYLTSSKEGYQKYQSSHLDLTNTSEPAIKENIPMKK
jgi:cysteine-rich repeat protein